MNIIYDARGTPIFGCFFRFFSFAFQIVHIVHIGFGLICIYFHEYVDKSHVSYYASFIVLQRPLEHSFTVNRTLYSQ